MDALSGHAPAREAEGLFQPIDPPPVHVAMLDACGVIVAANDGWAAAARDPRSTAGALGSIGSRYHDHCEAAARERPEIRPQLLRLSAATRAVLGGDEGHAFGFVVGERTYSARVLTVRGAGDDLTLVSIADTTEHPGGGAAAAMRDGLEALVDALDVGVVLQDPGGRALAWNPAAGRILGLTGDQFARRAPIDPRWTLLHEDGLPLPLEQRPSRIAFQTGKPCGEMPVGVRRPDGRVTWARIGAQPLVRDGEDRPWAVAVSLTDAPAPRARPAGDGGARAGEERYRALVEHSPDVVTIVDARGNVTYESPSVASVLGYAPGELVGTSQLARVHPDDVGPALSTVTALIGRPGESESCEYRIRARDGSWRVLESVVTNRLHDPAVRGLAVSTRDVTERRATETELRATTSGLENVVRSLRAGVLVEDEKRRVAVVNADLCEIFAIDAPPEALVGADCRAAARAAASLLAEPDRFVARIEELIEARRPVSAEEVAFSDGRTFERDYIPVSLRGRESAHLWVYRDISRRKEGEREAERARDEAIRAARRGSEFLATMSHEIRTPMHGVIGTVEMLLDTALEAHQRDLAELIRDAGSGLLSIVDDALDLSRIEAEQLEPRLADVDLAAVVEGVADLLLASVRRKGLELTVYVDPRIPARVRGDAQWLRQVLVNLGGNAAKFTDVGGIEIRVELEAQTAGASAVRFRVIDTGSGIPASERERLFEPFAQLEPGGDRRRGGGTGLGLAICRRLVRLMGGELVVDSAPARGSTFSFALTLPHSPAPDAVASPRRPARPLRVLFVEPREALAAIAAEYLAASGIAAEGVASAEAARGRVAAAAAAGAGFDVAIVGIGAEASVAAAELLRATPGCEAIALVMLTDVGAPAAAPEGLFARELTRPLKRAQLYDAVVGAAGAEERAPDGRPDPPPVPLPAGLRALVADDNEVNSELLVHQLARLGVDGEAVGGGREAVAAIARRPYDVVLMDARMPGVDGLQAARAIRRLAGERGAVPIVAVTASGTPGERAACLAAGMDEFLPKPISSTALAAALARALERRPPPAIAPAAAAIDAEAIARLDSDLGDRAELRRIAGIYLAQLGPGTRAIAAAVATHDGEALHAAAHRLGSPSATFGAGGVAELCQRLEALGAAGSTSGAEELVRALEGECARAVAQLRRLLELR